jgi:Putative zinc-finger
MCEYSGRLIAWLDHELGDQEATNVEWHVGQCAECRCAVNAYQQVSGAFLLCYEATMTVQKARNRPLWALSGVAAAAAILAAFLLAPPRTEKLAAHIPSPPHAPPMAFELSPAPVAGVRSLRRPDPVPVRSQWIAVEPTVEVALPADALFPPGAVPAGFSFIADFRP